ERTFMRRPSSAIRWAIRLRIRVRSHSIRSSNSRPCLDYWLWISRFPSRTIREPASRPLLPQYSSQFRCSLCTGRSTGCGSNRERRLSLKFPTALFRTEELVSCLDCGGLGNKRPANRILDEMTGLGCPWADLRCGGSEGEQQAP